MSLTALACCTIGMHIVSQHFPAHDFQNNKNYGMYLRGESWQAGMYKNTYSRNTVYAAYIKPLETIELMAGLANGYQVKPHNGNKRGFSRGYITPIGVVSYAVPVKVMGLTPRIFFSPGVSGASNVLHLSVEY